MTKLNEKNKRCKKLKNKIYRRYGDVWGRLALKKRDNFITSLVHNFERQAFGRRQRRLPPKLKTMVRKSFVQRLKKELLLHLKLMLLLSKSANGGCPDVVIF